MKKGLIVGIAIAAIVGLISIMGVIMAVGINNTEIGLRNQYTAQNKEVETTLDTMRKTLMSQFKVTKEFADKFIKVAQTQTEGRKGGGLIKLSTESAALGIDKDIYKKMMNSIEGQMAQFKRSQDTLTDVWRTHKTYCEVFPNSIIVGGNPIPEPVMISSNVTKETMKTKVLDDNILGE